MGSKVEAGPDIDNGGDKLDRRLSQGCEVVRHSNATVEGPGPSQEGVSKIAGDFIGCKGARSIQLSLQGNLQNGRPPPTIPPSHSLPSFSQHPQPQPPVGPLVRWERFLPIQALKVLLVENDDSTRHVVSALLRNCSYEVKTAANGLEAWKFLEDSNNHVDLVLSEVAMPGLSGIGLLSKIMSHATCKHTPVIMMSSYDSMGLVFKCLTKGAVDFLVKPIRKNELKNLWQHVWRRCHSSSGSGSESGIRAPSLGKPTSFDESDGSSGSNDEDSDSSIGLNARDGSDVGSGTQSSWTKRAAEIESPQPASQQDHLLDSAHDSTCAQVIRPKTETISDDWIPMSDDKNRREKDLVDGESLGKDLEEEMPKDASTHVESFPREKIHPSITGQSMEFVTEGTVKNNQKSGAMEQESIKVTCERSAQAADLFGAFGNTINSQIVSKSIKASNDTPDILASKDMAGRDVTEINPLEFNLKGPISVWDDATASNRNILRHSNHSAFSRYNVSTSSCQISAAFGETNEVTYHTNKELKKTNGCIRSPPLTEKSKTILAAKDTLLSAFSPVRLGPSGTEEVFQEKADDINGATAVQSKGIHVQVEHHHHHYHHHHIHGMQNQPQLQHPGHQQPYELKNITSTVPQCGSSNVYGGQIECNTINCSVNGSASGSNHGSNVLNVSSAAANAVGINKDESGAAAKGGGEDNNGSAGQSGSAIDHTRSAQREAALNKFRQKRKERCFEKKVRYQSRKKLAEQRPRLHGQFVRITTHEEDQDKSH